MNTPKRYTLRLPEISYGTEENPNGEFVRYDDYANLKAERDAIHSSKLVYFIHGEGRWANVIDENVRLKAEVELLKKEISLMSARQSPQVFNLLEIERLKAENERLRKAGDAMAAWIDGGQYDPAGYGKSDAWLAAKEVQS